HGPIAAGQKVLRSNRKFGRRLAAVRNIQNLSIEERDSVKIFARKRDRPSASPGFCADRIRFGKGGRTDFAALRKRNQNGRPGKKPEPALHDRVKYRLSVRRRTADQFENFSSCSLLMQRFVAFAREARGRRVFGSGCASTRGLRRITPQCLDARLRR